MIINSYDTDELLKSMISLQSKGFVLVAFPTDEVPDASNLAYFKTAYEASEHCYAMSTDVDFYKSLPLQEVIEDLKAVKPFGINTNVNEAIEISGLAALNFENMNYQNTNLNNTIMNEKNFEYLEKQVKFTGFGEEMKDDLRAKIEQKLPEFTLQHTSQYGQDAAVATLNFRKSDQTDMYFFNSYKLNVENEYSREKTEQTFYINYGNTMTLKEAYNLMQGRAVNKDLINREGEGYNSWVQMDFKSPDERGNYKLNHFHQNYGFDLEAELAKHPIRELSDQQQKDQLIDSLNRGNRQAVIFEKDGKEVMHFVEANPQFKTLNVYDEHMKRLDNRQSNDQTQSQGQQSSAKQSAKQGQDAEDDVGGKPKRKSQANSMK